MLHRRAGTAGTTPVVFLDSISDTDRGLDGVIVVTGSHGGQSAGEFALAAEPALVVFNDAGIGKAEAGIRALAMLGERGIPAAAVGHMTARIGEASETWAAGVLTRVNGAAALIGLAPGRTTREAVEIAFGVFEANVDPS